jgi:hypothetical protein
MTGYVVPDSIEPVVGWRAWFHHEGFLHSVVHPTRWEPGERVEAKCLNDYYPLQVMKRLGLSETHVSPHEVCRCGVYGAEFEQAIVYCHWRIVPDWRDSWIPGLDKCSIIGRVFGWGNVVEGDRGFRAQYAYPKDIYIVGFPLLTRWRLKRKLRAYGVPVYTARDMAEVQQIAKRNP